MIPGLIPVPNKGYMNNHKDNNNNMDDIMNEQTKNWSNLSDNNNKDVDKNINKVFDKSNNTEQELNILNSLIASKYNEVYISKKSPTNVLTKQKIELQQSNSEAKTSSVISTVDNNIMERETKQPKNCTRKKI